MKNIGGLMVMFGAGSMLLGFIGYEFTLMMWVDTWGPTMGSIIRGALIVIGAVLWVMGNKSESAQQQETDTA
jgi:hypothetical protein